MLVTHVFDKARKFAASWRRDDVLGVSARHSRSRGTVGVSGQQHAVFRREIPQTITDSDASYLHIRLAAVSRRKLCHYWSGTTVV